jgi:hypothetical protein
MESACHTINTKFDIASQLVANTQDNKLSLELESIRSHFALCTSHLFIKAVSGESGRAFARESLQRIIAAEGFITDIDNIVRRARLSLCIPVTSSFEKGTNGALYPFRGGDICNEFSARLRKKSKVRTDANCNVYSSPDGEIRSVSPNRKSISDKKSIMRNSRALLEQYIGYEVDCTTKVAENSNKIDRYNWCAECSTEMGVNSDTSELECPECHVCRELIGTVFDDSQFYNQEGQKAKSGSFNPNRHFRFWMDRILAREPEEELGDKDAENNTCGEMLLQKMRTIVRRDNKILRMLNVDDVRAMLKELGRTDLNKNVPLIMKKLTGVGPTQLPESLCQRVEKLFSKAIEIGERTRSAKRTNRNYYPYYIYKILDSILPEDDHEHRRVLYHIYMQGKDTLDKNDREWEIICEELPSIEWVHTDRNKARNYFPR